MITERERAAVKVGEYRSPKADRGDSVAYQVDIPKGVNVEISGERIIEVIETALAARARREGIFANEYSAPETPLLENLRALGKKNSDPYFLLHGIFLVTSVLFADSSVNQLKRLTKPDAFERHSWLYDPARVMAKSQDEVEAAVTDYVKPNGNKDAVPFWRPNAELIELRYGGNLNNYLRLHDFSAPAIARDLALAKKKRPDSNFHRYGPKIARLFLHWVQQYRLAEQQLVDFDEIGIPIDFQVIRILVQTGAIKIEGATPIGRILRPLAPLMEQVCLEVSRKHKVGVDYIHQTLWETGVRGCNELRHVDCSIAGMCKFLLSRDPYDSSSLIVPYDIGRHVTRARGKTIRYDKKTETFFVERSKTPREKIIDKGQQELPI